MGEPDLLITHAERWATGKSRSVESELLRQIVNLRLRYDELPPGAWPAGSAERLLLVTWPAYGPQPPDPDSLRETLDTFWSFLRATGRMAGGSATPAELRKEVRRALPKMAAACEDPANHAQGRVLGDFGRSIGVDLDGAADVADLKARVAQVTAAWNALPTEERARLMPDPSPKSLTGQRMTAAVNRLPWPEPEPDDFDAEIEPGDVKVSAQLARSSAFVAACLALVEWLGQGKPVTPRGLLRPPVAREAYRHLDLWQWQRRFEAVKRGSYGVPATPMTAEADALLAESALNSWRSAGDCLALDRLWYACDAADQVELTRSTARRGQRAPETDEEWRDLALVLLLGLCFRLGWYVVEPMAGMLLLAVVAEDEVVPLDAVRAWWDSRCPESLRNLDALRWQERLDVVMFHFEDANLWTVVDDRYTLTDLGRDFAIVFVNAIDSGLLDDD
ncbi:hypothetical protein [Nocardioides endophyticus]